MTGTSATKANAMRFVWVERHGTGFTIMELLIVLIVVGLLLTIALPQFHHYLQRSHRVEAITMLTEAAACQERVRTETGNYDPARCLSSLEGARYYRLTSAATSDESANGFVLTATPLNPAKDDDCGSLSLDHTGRRSISGPPEKFWTCWSGR